MIFCGIFLTLLLGLEGKNKGLEPEGCCVYLTLNGLFPILHSLESRFELGAWPQLEYWPALPVPRPGRDRESRLALNTVLPLQYFVGVSTELRPLKPARPGAYGLESAS